MRHSKRAALINQKKVQIAEILPTGEIQHTVRTFICKFGHTRYALSEDVGANLMRAGMYGSKSKFGEEMIKNQCPRRLYEQHGAEIGKIG